MRKPLIIGNWKMNLNLTEAISLVKEIKARTDTINNVGFGICPPFVFLPEINKITNGSNIVLGSQNIHNEENGAFTGEVSGLMVKEVGCTHAIIGHSERRHVFGETDEFINAKLKTCFSIELTPIFCVGETLDDREGGKTNDVIGRQLLNGLQEISSENAKNLIIAYEPVWAIGTGKTATPEQANDVHVFIRNFLVEKYGREIADGLIIQYGGSVKPGNIKDLLAQSEIDGALVGGASLEANSFIEMIEITKSL